MLEAGAFDGIHAAMMVHPATKEYADHHTRALVGLRASYTGRTAHSAAAPHEGINAGDAATVAQVAIGLLRQQLLPGALVHGIVTKGGEAANSIPGAAELLYDARANSVKELAEVKKQLIVCFEAGAVATGASLHITEETREFSGFRNDQPMVGFYQANAESLGRRFDDEPLEKRLSEAASTDMANVSLAIPSIHPVIRVEAHGASNHQPEFARWCASEDADKAALEGGAAMAWTAIDLALDTTERRRLITVGESSGPGAEAADF
ncbi:peptidase M20 domain-containing protein 2 [Arthrobacter sp. Hiyo1]|uniref:peptidase dimerization domain-containing protein n=1 Tax=Arthrobacter sp. Hiyo1 TaxID=1588020 RepID=UPI0006A3CB82|nr:peptidase dimerization domain-containing protein [Arthrobacter sp. Hiyo1]GAP60992.1 peptidase M20 domain-containing protein 2 [Arthrobacter sp. Hiyo1]